MTCPSTSDVEKHSYGGTKSILFFSNFNFVPQSCVNHVFDMFLGRIE